MIKKLKKILTIILITFLSSSLFYAENAATDYDDIFANQKIEKDDFYTILVEPSKKEIQEQNNKFFEEVKQKKLEILRKKQKEFEKKESAKNSIVSQKEKQKAELEKQKENLKNKKNNSTAQKTETKTNDKNEKNQNNQKINKAEEKNKKESVDAKSKQQSNQKTKKIEQNKSEKSEKQQKENFQDAQTEKIEETFVNKENEEKNEEKEMDFSIQLRKKFIDCGMDFKGIKYVWGGKTPNPGFDCSGFITYTAKKSLDLDIKGNAQDIYNQTTPVSLNEAQPGDLIFFKGDTDTRITHVGIYLGKNPEGNDFGKQNLFLNAASAGPRTGIVISGLNENYWKKTYYGCGRLLPSI